MLDAIRADDHVEALRLPVNQLQQILDRLSQQGFRTLGPTLTDSVVTIADISQVEQLPRGVVDDQQPGVYRAKQTDAPNYFKFNLGADSWKRHLFPSRRLLFETGPDLIATSHSVNHQPPLAFLGVRACDLLAMSIQQKVFDRVDDHYQRQLAEAFIIGVHCQSAAATCFCPSTGSGPEFTDSRNLDLLLTEIVTHAEHFFLVEARSTRAIELLAPLNLAAAKPEEKELITAQLQATRSQIRKSLPADTYDLLRDNLDAARWDNVAERCLSCGNCTFVCPTCFCSDVEDHTDIEGNTAQRWQVWDSCFHQGHSYTHAGTVRETTRARYRQWLTHKLSTWYDQFDTSGCTGCGRCITWCPVGIDLTEEVAAISHEASHEK